jgi:hypothetical protein
MKNEMLIKVFLLYISTIKIIDTSNNMSNGQLNVFEPPVETYTNNNASVARMEVVNNFIERFIQPIIGEQLTSGVSDTIQQSLNSENPYKNVLSEDGKKQLQEFKYKKNLRNSSNDDGNNACDVLSCPILMTEFEDGEDIIKLPCDHIFNKEAITQWLENEKSECPVCRYKLKSKEVRRDGSGREDDEDEDEYGSGGDESYSEESANSSAVFPVSSLELLHRDLMRLLPELTQYSFMPPIPSGSSRHINNVDLSFMRPRSNTPLYNSFHLPPLHLDDRVIYDEDAELQEAIRRSLEMDNSAARIGDSGYNSDSDSDSD